MERLNQTMKGMLAKAIKAYPRSWGLYVGPILFALREPPQASTGFSPFELLYGRDPRGLLETLEGNGGRAKEPKAPEVES